MIIFLDIDGVLNCQLFYQTDVHKNLRGTDDDMDFYKNQLCPEMIQWLNGLCKDINAEVVISSSWRIGKTVEELTKIFNYCGGTFNIIDKTKHFGHIRGAEIYEWLRENITPDKYGCHYFDFKDYVIIDDDSDMLLWQKEHFFQTDNYSGLTPTTCYKIKRFYDSLRISK